MPAASCDESVFAVAPVDGVARPFVAEGFQIQKPLLKHIMAFAGPRAHAVIFLHVAGERPHLLPIGCRFAQFDHGLGVRGAHGRADDHGRVEAFAHVHGFDHEILAFLAVAGFQHGELAELGIVAVVLLVLGAEQARIVRRDHHEGGFRARVGRVEQGVGKDVHPDLLGRDHRTAPRVGRARGGVHGDFFVHGPFRIDFFVLRHILEDLGTGRPGIAAGDLDARFQRAARQGLIS